MKMVPHLYLDMDGVTADFDGALAARGIGDIESYIAKPQHEWTPEQVEHDKLVTVAMNDNAFWTGIKPFPMVEQFYDSCLRLSPHKVKHLTALPRSSARAEPVSVIKRAWLWRYLKVHPGDVITCLRSEKQKFACTGAVLVDDNAQNCTEFAAAGGTVILHKDFITTLQELRKIYER